MFILEWTSLFHSKELHYLYRQYPSDWAKINTNTHSTSLVFNSKAQTLAISEFVRQSQEKKKHHCQLSSGAKIQPMTFIWKKKKRKSIYWSLKVGARKKGDFLSWELWWHNQNKWKILMQDIQAILQQCWWALKWNLYFLLLITLQSCTQKIIKSQKKPCLLIADGVLLFFMTKK